MFYIRNPRKIVSTQARELYTNSPPMIPMTFVMQLGSYMWYCKITLPNGVLTLPTIWLTGKRSIAAFRGDPVVFLVGGKVRDEEGYGGVEGIVGMGETPMLHAMIAAMILLLGWFQDSRPMYSLLQQYPPCRMGQGYCKERVCGTKKNKREQMDVLTWWV